MKSLRKKLTKKIDEFILYIRDNVEPSEEVKQIFDKILIENGVGEKQGEYADITNSILRVHRNKRNRFILKDFPLSVSEKNTGIYEYLRQFGIDESIIAEKDIPIEFRAAYEDFVYEKAYLEIDKITLKKKVTFQHRGAVQSLIRVICCTWHKQTKKNPSNFIKNFAQQIEL